MKSLAVLLLTTLSCAAQGFSDASAPFLMSTSSLRRGLVGYWRLEGGAPLWKDESATGVDLTANNGVAAQAGKVGNCGAFASASPRWLSAANTNLLNFTTSAFTIAAWVKLTNNAAINGIVDKFQLTDLAGYTLNVQADRKLYLQIYQTSAKLRYVSGTTTINDSNWHLVMGMHDGTMTTNGMSLYVDGVAQALPGRISTGTVTDFSSKATFDIGAFDTGTSPANGLIDEVGVWNRVLSSTEIARVYNAGLGTHFPWAHP